jgi:predicted deacylase
MPRRLPTALFALLLIAVSLPAGAFATTGPSAEPAGILAEGTRWATPYYVVDSGKEGPTVMVVGGIHGNEPAGTAAADAIRQVPVRRGKLVVLPRANVPGLEAKKRRLPGIDRDRSDLNRNFPKADGAAPRGQSAGAIWELVTRVRPDWLVDLHESVNFRKADPKRVGNTIIHAVADETRRRALAMIEAVNTGIDDEEKQFILLRNPAKGSLARSAADRLGASAMIVETTRRDQPLALRVRQHRLLVERLLADLGMINRREDSPRPAVEAEAGR